LVGCSLRGDSDGKPPALLTLRWLFPYFEGIDLHHTRQPTSADATEALRLTEAQRLDLPLHGLTNETGYLAFQKTTVRGSGGREAARS
jgi:hypothetical protein